MPNIKDISAWSAGQGSGSILSGDLLVGAVARAVIASGVVGSGSFAAVSAVEDLGPFTGGVAGFLDASERDGIRIKINAILLSLKNVGIMLSG